MKYIVHGTKNQNSIKLELRIMEKYKEYNIPLYMCFIDRASVN